MEIEIGRGKTARQAYGFDDIAIVPSRRTRDPRDVSIDWEFSYKGRDYAFPLPVLASAMDGVVDPAFAITLGKLGGLAVLNLEGIQTRYADPGPQLDAIASFSREEATREMQKIYAAEDVKPELVKQRVAEIKAGGVLAAASLTPQNVERLIGPALEEIATELNGKVKIVKMNVDENQQIPAQFGIRSIPTLMLFKDGKLASQKVGAAPKSDLSRWISTAV